MPHRHSLYGSSLGNDEEMDDSGSTVIEAELRTRIDELEVQTAALQIALADVLERKKHAPPKPGAVFDPGTATWIEPDNPAGYPDYRDGSLPYQEVAAYSGVFAEPTPPTVDADTTVLRQLNQIGVINDVFRDDGEED